jgi:kynurenine formamidase
MIFLSYILDNNTPTYGNRNKFKQTKKSDINKGDSANDTFIKTTVHIGTHIDMPYHFFENGQTIKDFDANFWKFKKPLIIHLKPKNLIIKDELIDKLKLINDINYDLLIVKTGICDKRNKDEFWSSNFGFHSDIYDFLINEFPHIRVFGFDSISVSSIQNRVMGKKAHRAFLNPLNPILLLEDMNLQNINIDTLLKEVIISPLRIANCDGLPCTVFGVLNE